MDVADLQYISCAEMRMARQRTTSFFGCRSSIRITRASAKIIATSNAATSTTLGSFANSMRSLAKLASTAITSRLTASWTRLTGTMPSAKRFGMSWTIWRPIGDGFTELSRWNLRGALMAVVYRRLIDGDIHREFCEERLNCAGAARHQRVTFWGALAMKRLDKTSVRAASGFRCVLRDKVCGRKHGSEQSLPWLTANWSEIIEEYNEVSRRREQ